jgi:hypothetical protein
MDTLAKANLPAGFTYEWTELAYQQSQAGNTGALVFGLAVVFVFLLLAAQYESLVLPLAVILIVPMCLLAAIVGVAMFSTAPREVPPTLPPADDQPANTTPAPTDADQAHPALALIEPPPPTETDSERGATPPTPPAAPTDVDPPAMAASTQAPAPALPAVPPAPPEPAPSPAAKAAVREQAAWQERATQARDHFDGTVRWVLVDDPDNEADTVTGLGSVSQPFYIAQYELTNADYCVYLNASKAGRDDWRGVGSRAIERVWLPPPCSQAATLSSAFGPQ